MQKEMLQRLVDAGISVEDAYQLRRISMTLQRWFELECGDSNNYASWCITRGNKHRQLDEKTGGYDTVFVHDDDGQPYIERHIHSENTPRYEKIADRENGARRRLARIMANYPTLRAYIQTDPRGASLYILPEGVTAENYNNGIAVYK